MKHEPRKKGGGAGRAADRRNRHRPASGSGKAMAIMPMLIPLADMVGITRQTAILAFQFGDGISNTFWFTNGTMLIFFALAKIPLSKWYKFIVPLEIVLCLLSVVFMMIAVKINYGPF